MDRVLAKLEAFMESPDYLLERYKNQNDETSNYKKSVAFFRKGELAQALALLDKIIVANSNTTLKSKYNSLSLNLKILLDKIRLKLNLLTLIIYISLSLHFFN
jgi:hypothetical protein